MLTLLFVRLELPLPVPAPMSLRMFTVNSFDVIAPAAILAALTDPAANLAAVIADDAISFAVIVPAAICVAVTVPSRMMLSASIRAVETDPSTLSPATSSSCAPPEPVSRA